MFFGEKPLQYLEEHFLPPSYVAWLLQGLYSTTLFKAIHCEKHFINKLKWNWIGCSERFVSCLYANARWLPKSKKKSHLQISMIFWPLLMEIYWIPLLQRLIINHKSWKSDYGKLIPNRTQGFSNKPTVCIKVAILALASTTKYISLMTWLFKSPDLNLTQLV